MRISRYLLTAVLLFSMSSLGENAETVKVRGRGTGMSKMEALKDAYRDAVEQAVGLYVDAEQMVRQEELVKDQILTQSNAYIEKYEIAKEAKSENGLFQITILANVRNRALARRIMDVMPTYRASLASHSKDLHAKIVTDLKATDDAVSIVRNELAELSPLKHLLKVKLMSYSPVPESVEGNPNSVRLWYPVKVEVDENRYYNDFMPRWLRILDQIKTAPVQKLSMSENAAYAKAYDETVVKEYGIGRTGRKGIMTRNDRPNNINTCEYRGDKVHFYYADNQLWSLGMALNEEYLGIGFWNLHIGDSDYVLHGCKLVNTACLGAFNRADLYDSDKPQNKLINRFFASSRNSSSMVGQIAEDCDFTIGVVKNANKNELIGFLYKIPPECINEICVWQNRMAFGDIDHGPHGGLFVAHRWTSAPEVSYKLSFLNGTDDEIASTIFPLRNIELTNLGCVLLEEPDRRDHLYVGGKYLWLITPLVGSMAKGFVKWVYVDMSKDEVAKIADATISVENQSSQDKANNTRRSSDEKDNACSLHSRRSRRACPGK